MNSVTIKPTPLSSFINRRKDESVTPAIGASARFGVILTLPMLISPVITKQKSLAHAASGRNHLEQLIVEPLFCSRFGVRATMPSRAQRNDESFFQEASNWLVSD